MDRPIAKFAIGLALGFLTAVSISIPVVFVGVTFLVLFLLFKMRSAPALAGVLLSFGLTWIILIGSTVARCKSMGPDCVSGDAEVALIVIGVVLVTVGLILSALLVLTSKPASTNG